MVQAIIGHNWLSYHQNKLNTNISQTCRLRNTGDESFIHLISTCPALRQVRTDIFLDKTIEPNNEWSIKGLNKFISTSTINSLLTDKNNYYVQGGHIHRPCMLRSHLVTNKRSSCDRFISPLRGRLKCKHWVKVAKRPCPGTEKVRLVMITSGPPYAQSSV